MNPPGPTSVAILATALLPSCLAPAPQAAVPTRDGVVRAATVAEAREVSSLVDRLQPRILDLLPDTRFEELEVWVQDEPALYRFPHDASTDAEGLWAESHARILLARSADSLERTLAHELVHAALGDSWTSLPGSLEEGLCDLVSVQLVSDGAARLRAGRLSSAALACGGLRLELSVLPSDAADGCPAQGWSARIVLSGNDAPKDAHLDVFRISAGLSSSTLDSGEKRGYYGLSYLVIDRIVSRYGFAGLNDMCRAAWEDGYGRVPGFWLLEAAELDEDSETWRRAAAGGLGEAELVELLRMYPDFVIDALAEYLSSVDGDDLDGLDAELVVVDGNARVDVSRLEFIRRGVAERLRER